MKREERIRVAVNMSKVVTAVCIDSIRDSEDDLTEEELIARVRARIMYGRRRWGEE